MEQFDSWSLKNLASHEWEGFISTLCKKKKKKAGKPREQPEVEF